MLAEPVVNILIMFQRESSTYKGVYWVRFHTGTRFQEKGPEKLKSVK